MGNKYKADRIAKRITRPTDTRRSFVPSLAVYRDVLDPDGEIDTALRAAGDALKAELHPRKSRQYYAYDAGRLVLRVVEQKGLVQQLRESQRPPTRRQMKDLGYSIPAKLRKLLPDTGGEMVVPIGSLAVFDQNKIGLVPAGWKGSASRYGEDTPNAAFVTEKQFCFGAIANVMSGDDSFSISPLERTPHIVIMSKAKPIRPHEFREVENIIGAYMPESVTLSDPWTAFQLGDRRGDDKRLPLRAVPSDEHQIPSLRAVT